MRLEHTVVRESKEALKAKQNRIKCRTQLQSTARAQKPAGRTPNLLPGDSHGGKSLVGYSPWGHKESDTTERLQSSLRSKINNIVLGYSIKYKVNESIFIYK